MLDETENETYTWTVEQILNYIPELGIPHFQRGMVWSDELKAALLESLFYDTPCGSFVLWAPQNPESFGVTLDSADSEKMKKMKYLVIDGQQRIRSLRSIFEEDEEERVWCVNLVALPSLGVQSDLVKRQRSLFVPSEDPKQFKGGKPIPPNLRNLLPIKVIEGAPSWADPAIEPYRRFINIDKGLVECAYPKLRATIEKMKTRKFFISLNREGGLREMVDLYNRINSGGRRVEAEERAFARLVGLQPKTYENLKMTFDEVHPKQTEVSSAGREKDRTALERDDVMKRQREQAFGFKLFVRVFMQACQYHLGFPRGRTEFSFEIADRPPFLTAFGGLDSTHADKLWKEARDTLSCVSSVLRNELHCDDFRFLPDANSLMPVFQLLIRFRGLQTDKRYRPLLAVLIQRLLLAELDSRTVLRLIYLAGDPGKVAALQAIYEMLALLKEERLADSQIETRLKQAKSLQHRYVLLLYALERSRGVKDLSYGNYEEFRLKRGEEMNVDVSAEAQKQHMLPFSKAQKLYPDLTRGASHLGNSIGNLTYISGELNSCFGGLGEIMADLALEKPLNLWGHVLQEGKLEVDERLLRDYRELRDAFATNDYPLDSSVLRKTFDNMITRRRGLLFDAFKGWMQEVEHVACKAFQVNGLDQLMALAEGDGRIEGERPWYPKFGPVSLVYFIQKLGYSNAEEDRLVSLLAHGCKPSPSKWKDGESAYRLKLTEKRWIWVKMAPPDVWLRFDKQVPVRVRRQVCELLGLGSLEDTHVAMKPVPRFDALLAHMSEIEKELASFSKP